MQIVSPSDKIFHDQEKSKGVFSSLGYLPRALKYGLAGICVISAVLFIVGVSLLAKNSNSGSSTSASSVALQDQVNGRWISESVENSGGIWGVRDFQISQGNTWEIRFTVYLDQAKSSPIFQFRTFGPFLLGNDSTIVAGAKEASFFMQKKYLTLLTTNVQVLNGFGFSACNLSVGMEHDVSAVGCSFLQSVLACDREYDLLALKSGKLYFGKRTNNMCSISGRPVELAEALVPASTPLNLQEKITGRYVSKSIEPVAGTQLFGIREFNFTGGLLWSLSFTMYGDQAKTFPIFNFRTYGPFVLLADSSIVPGTKNASFYMSRKFMTLLTNDAGTINGFGFASCNLNYGEEKDISDTGCSFLHSVSACEYENDLLSLKDNGELYMGDRSGNLCISRPQILGLPLVRA